MGELADKARSLAQMLHKNQIRKSNGMGYFDAHLNVVAALLIEAGCSGLAVALGYLHDALEDQGGTTTEAQINALDPRLLRILKKDLSEDKSLPWKTRKTAVINHINDMCDEAAQVKAADLLSNLRGLMRDGYGDPKIWDRFKAGRTESLWFYEHCVHQLAGRSFDGDIPYPLMMEVRVIFEWVKEHV
jgi:(p)ppGpp synthase/HD superfamily hydrolase